LYIILLLINANPRQIFSGRWEENQ